MNCVVAIFWNAALDLRNLVEVVTITPKIYEANLELLWIISLSPAYMLYEIALTFNSYLLQRRRLITHANAKSKSEKFPPPHQDGDLGYPLGSSQHMDPVFDASDVPFSSTNLSLPKADIHTWSGPLVDPGSIGAPRRKKKHGR